MPCSSNCRNNHDVLYNGKKIAQKKRTRHCVLDLFADKKTEKKVCKKERKCLRKDFLFLQRLCQFLQKNEDASII